MKVFNQIVSDREEKARKMRNYQENPYPVSSKRTHTNKEALDFFDDLSKKEEEIFLVGRIRTIRGHGSLFFADLEDGTGFIQLAVMKNKLGEKSFNDFKSFFDIGDFIQVKGSLFLTKKKEKTIFVSGFRMLTKSIRPLPEKWHGIKDDEERLRKRYLDILFNPELKDMFQKKSIFWNSTRSFLIGKGFLEVETPVLENTAGGADAKPFQTHHNALDMDVFLRISMGELWQKRLMVAGFEKTFEIGRQFRNEGMDAEHLQDYSQMEFYWAYADHKEGMRLVEDLYRFVAQETFNTQKFKIKGFDIDLSKEWERYDYRTIVSQQTKIDIFEDSLQDMQKTIEKLKIKYDKKGFNRSRAVDLLWKYCRKKIAGPGFLINHPVDVSPLAKRNEKYPEIAARFQVILAGSELGNGYSELNDPRDQEERFLEQQKLRDSGDEEAQMLDGDFVEALEYGMPPTCGFGFSERLFSFLIDKPMRECQIFPLMKPKR